MLTIKIVDPIVSRTNTKVTFKGDTAVDALKDN